MSILIAIVARDRLHASNPYFKAERFIRRYPVTVALLVAFAVVGYAAHDAASERAGQCAAIEDSRRVERTLIVTGAIQFGFTDKQIEPMAEAIPIECTDDVQHQHLIELLSQTPKGKKPNGR